MKIIKLCTFAAILVSSTAAYSTPIELLTNGDFETGTYAGWMTTSQDGSSGNLFIDTPGSTSPQSGFSTAANGDGGVFYSVTDQSGPGAYSLRQMFSVTPNASTVLLKFKMFANSYGGGPTFGNGLDKDGIANQHARVDILTAGAGAFELGTAVLQNFYLGVDSTGNNPNSYIQYSFDITSLVGMGGTFQLRFAQVDNQGNFNLGVDNVSILADSNTVPEPATFAFFGLALGGLLYSRRARI